jgi:hypothetical protein
MKQALPNGEWFQVHRAFHIAALFVALIGFILAFVANRGNNGLITLGSQNKSGTAHFVLGIIIMALQIANVSAATNHMMRFTSLYITPLSANSPS